MPRERQGRDRRFADLFADLRAILDRAAADGFAGVEAEGLGATLRTAADRIVEDRDALDDLARDFDQFRSGLDRFDARGRVDRSRVVAHGLRLCMTVAAAAAPARTPPRREDLGTGRARTGKTSTTAKKGSQRKVAAPIEATSVAPDAPDASPRAFPPTVLPGIGPKTAQRFADRGLHTLEDLAYLLPLEYRDRRTVRPLAEVEEGEEALVAAEVTRYRQGWFRGRFSATGRVSTRTLDGAVGPDLELRWFHAVGGLGERMVTGAQVLVAGSLKTYKGRATMVHPTVIPAEEGPPGVVVRYPIVEGVGAATLARACRTAAELIAAHGDVAEPLPPDVRERHRLMPARDALAYLHAPPADIETDELALLCSRESPAHRRLAFDEFFFLRLAQERQRASWTAQRCSFGPVPPGSFDRERLRASIPFEPTGAQWRALSEIEADLATGQPMLRLLQGDVGAGKTVVAFGSALAVLDAGGQAAIMAPTEILARQHLRTLEPWCELAGVRVALLTGSTSRPERATRLALLREGQIDILVGTHALITEDVAFQNLGLVVVDEQHRFGVEQRARLRDKGGLPHLLVMTATPIPRSLALTVFGDLNATAIDELPPGRETSTTTLAFGKRGLTAARKQLLRRVAPVRGKANSVTGGSRAFVVVPLVEASEAVDASDVEATAAALREMDPGVVVEVVHGRMKADEKDAAMERFRRGDARVLVATTVIEVGVDVPEADVMLIEHAERFGLAQLHQLRGRIGRGGGASTCVLHTASAKDSDAAVRLAVMERTADGFEIAQADLELRGPGEVYGRRQSGVPKLRFAAFNAEGLRMLEAAREAAAEVHAADPTLERSPAVRDELERRIGGQVVRSGEAG